MMRKIIVRGCFETRGRRAGTFVHREAQSLLTSAVTLGWGFLKRRLCLFAGLVLWSICTADADTVVLNSVADTTLSEIYPANNSGGLEFVNAGRTQNATTNRGLYRFDLSSIPAGSKITRASLLLEVVREPPAEEDPPTSTFAIFRLLLPWGEGNKISLGNARAEGGLATTNEATWTHRFALTDDAWSVPGGAAGIDYAANATASRGVFGVADSPYEFGPTATMTSDVQLWLDDPGANFGWILISQLETMNFTARSFGSRESLIGGPQLTVDFIAPPPIGDVHLADGQFQFSFQAEPDQPYAVEFRTSMAPANDWATLTNFPASSTATNVFVSAAIAAEARFFRVLPR